MTISRRGAHCMANGIRLHYVEFYSAPDQTPILLLPGITSPAVTWSFVAERLATTHRVLVLDIRGRGLSESRSGSGYTLDDYVQDARGVIEVLKLERPIVIGHSMGARIAARLGTTAPNLLSKLVLVDPPLSGPGRAPYPTPLSNYLNAIEAASRGATIDEFRRYTPTWTDEQIALRLEWLPTCSVEAVTQSHRMFHEEDIFPDFARLICPTLFIHAAKATVVTPEQAKEIATLLPDGQTVPVAAGHMIPWDNLQDFLAVMRPFLEAP
jgi:N-formylmaleamate deformylase